MKRSILALVILLAVASPLLAEDAAMTPWGSGVSIDGNSRDGSLGNSNDVMSNPVGCCKVAVAPTGPFPVVVPQGGSFGWNGRLCDTCTFGIVTDVWYGVRYLNVFYQQGAFLNISLASMQCVSGLFTQNVPISAPLGNYDFVAYCGTYNSIKDDSSSFPFTVVGAAGLSADLSAKGKTAVIPASGAWALDGNSPSADAVNADEPSLLPPSCGHIGISPLTFPVIVPQGGSFGWAGVLCDTCSTPTVIDVWFGVIYLSVFYQQGVLLNISLTGGQCISGVFTQAVPITAPIGNYTYVAYCGTYNMIKDDSSTFPFQVVGAATGREDAGWGTDEASPADLPNDFSLVDCYPNPFNATTTISYQLPEAANVTLDIYNMMGQKVATLVDGETEAGRHSVSWDAGDKASGVYFYRLGMDDKVFTKRMTLLK